MPCMCWFDPPEGDKKMVKFHCEEIIKIVKRLRAIGDPLGLELSDVKKLLDHLYEPKSCDKN